MSHSFDFLAALFAAHEGPIAFEHNNKTVKTRDPAFVEEHDGELYVSPTTPDGRVAFVFGTDQDVDADVWEAFRLKPTVVLYKEKTGDMIVAWAFEETQDIDDVRRLAEALGMADLEEPIPLPGTNGWSLVRAEESDYYLLDEVERVYAPDKKTGYDDPPKNRQENRQNSDTQSAQASEKAGKKASSKTGKKTGADAPPWDEDLGTYADAVIKRPYDEGDPALAQEIIVSVGANSKSMNWQPKAMPLGAFVAQFCQHREGAKDGVSFVLGDMVPGQRKKTAIKALYAVGLDVDVGMSSAAIDAALAKFGRMAVRYTTHSHLKAVTDVKKDVLIKWCEQEADGADYEEDEVLQRYFLAKELMTPDVAKTVEFNGTEHKDGGIMVTVKHAPIAKHRIIVPLAAAFDISKVAPTQKEAMDKWAKVPTALARELGVPLDKSCLDPSRLFYLPRHAKGKPFEISLFGGDLFDWKSLTLDDPFEAEIAKLTKGTSKSKTEAGRNLGRWSMKAAHGFQVVQVMEEHCPDKLRHQVSAGYEIECPFDELHSNAGDTEDRACLAVNAGDGPSEWFTVRCQHESCREFTNLDMLGKMVEDGWFDRDVLDDETYNIVEAENAPNPQAAKKIEKEDKAKEAYMQAIFDLPESDFTDDDVEKVLRVCCEANLGTLAENKAKEALKARLGVTGTVINKMFKDMKATVAREQNAEGAVKDPLGRSIFAYAGEFNFDEAFACCFRALVNTNREKDQPIFSCLQDKPVRMAPEPDGRLKFTEIGTAASMGAELNELVTFVRKNEQGQGARGRVPDDVARHVFEKAYTRLPRTPEIMYTPIYTAEGDLIRKPGWYQNLDILMADIGFDVPKVFSDPTPEEVEDAVKLLTDEVLIDFPFLDYDTAGNERREPSMANALAMLITPFMRRMIDSCTPVFFVSKPTPGTGGTFLGMVPIILFDGEEPAPIRYTQNEEEMQKALLASLMNSKAYLFFDDVKEFNNRVLLMAITSRYIGGRVLGSSKNIEMPNNSIWIATGNNPLISSEMARRVVDIRLNAKTSDIQKRTYKHPDYVQWLKANRGEIVHAILTLIAHWINCGMPKFTARKRASFEDWSEKVGGVLMCANIEGFLDNRRSVAADMDEAAIKQLVRDWLLKWGEKTQVKIADLWSYAYDMELDIVSGANDDQKKARFMRILPTLDGRTFKMPRGDCMVRAGSDADGNVTYHLERLSATEEVLETA
ncbi:hypothetical protein Ccr2_gp142 [Caulobacter phage Ccr2]|nr:hypothetical protein Ccr10_gp143 [Caulobacter phage Ccr10]ARB14017.1 hypothetical protein Ccr2_gp142 [Caulobacter phage Ccr2]ARB14705.1 hypothetical protein Ccr29_gp149 [Caulobacter phage Ccr29]